MTRLNARSLSDGNNNKKEDANLDKDILAVVEQNEKNASQVKKKKRSQMTPGEAMENHQVFFR